MILRNFLIALRLPFISASILPFVYGALMAKNNFRFFNFMTGIFTVACVHLSANLINDYADSKSGVDWQDLNFYQFFGGSKLIQQKVFGEKFYFNAAVVFALLSGLGATLLAVILKTPVILGFYAAVIFLAWFYSQKPLQFSYHGLGELVIFMLFGPVLVMGGYFIQSGIFPAAKGFLLSLPLAFLITAVLFANEVPDYPQDIKKNKRNWVNFTGLKNAFILYDILVFLAFASLVLNIVLRYLSLVALCALPLILLASGASRILKRHYADKNKLIRSCALTVKLHMLVSLVLILSLWL